MRGTTIRRSHSSAALLAAFGLFATALPAAALPPVSTPLTSLSVSANTGEKPQSKVWTYAGRWWCVMPNASGTFLWRLDGSAWTSVLQLSASTSAHADVRSLGGVSHVLLFDGASGSQLASVEYVPATQDYRSWSGRPGGNVALALDSGVETATIDVDSQGRMWLASQLKNGTNEVRVRYSDAPYAAWSAPITLATGINADDISAVIAIPGGKVGVMWSNQNTKRFGFRVHVDGADPATWGADEVPASQSALDVGAGMADDHIHLTAAADGTVYAAVKTSYDTAGYPKMALLVRRPGGTWDDLYEVDQAGTRPIVLLDESARTLTVAYTSSEGSGNILYKESAISPIAFGASATLIPGGVNDATSTKQTLVGSVVVLAGNGTGLSGVLRQSDAVGWWPMEEGSGSVLFDATGHAANGSVFGSPAWVAGAEGLALSLSGAGQYATVPDAAALDVSGSITLAAWVKPGVVATQNLVGKSTNGGLDGYELCLASATSTAGPNKVFVRFNQASSGDTYRVNSTTLYSDRLDTWMHLAATYDGATIKLYVNGALENSMPAAITIATNALPLAIGAQVDGAGTATRLFTGALDEVRVYDRALDAAAVQALYARAAASFTLTATAGSGGSVTPSGAVVVARGASQTFTILPDPGHHIADVRVDGGSVGAVSSYTFTNVTSDHALSASFASDGAADLVGRWTMEEGSGATLTDVSGQGNDASLTGSPTWGTGVEGLALVLNGTGQYALAPHSASLDVTGPITLAAWVRTGKTGTQEVIAKANYGGSDGYELNLSSGGKPFFRLNGAWRLDAVTPYPVGVWTHIAATYDGTTSRIYVNGTLDNSGGGPSGIVSNTLPLGIGAQSNGDAGRLFQGALDDARVYARALSASEIAALASVSATTYTITATAEAGGSITPSGIVTVSAGATQSFSIVADAGYHLTDVRVDGVSVGAVSGYTFTNVTANHTLAASFAADSAPGELVGWWRLDGDVTDASTYGNNGSLPNGGSWVAGIRGQALGLNGTSQYALVPHAASLDTVRALTLAAWIRPSKLGTQPVIAKETYAGTPVWGYALELSSVSPGVPFFRLDSNTPGAGRLEAVTPYPQDGNTWMHLAASYDGDTMKLYFNGTLNAWQARTIPIPTNTLPVAIGAQSGAEAGRWFQGAIDDARIYGRALSAGEILALASHAVTAAAGAHGTITPAGTVAVAHGSSATFTITPDEGYRVADVVVDAVSVGAVTSYTFPGVAGDHAISATFAASAPPGAPTPSAPPDLASGVTLPPALDVIATDPDSPSLTVQFWGRARNASPGPDFTVVALPDAQNYTGQVGSAKNAMFEAQTRWCVEQRSARNIVSVQQLGDCVETASDGVQWLRADTTFSLLEDPVTTGLHDGIPYGVSVGNHDQDPKDDPDGSTENYNAHFGAARFQGRAYYGGHFADNNDTWFQYFSASGLDFMVVSLEFDGSPDANRLGWADSLLKAHPGRRAIVVSHSILGPGNPGAWDGPGLTIYNALKGNPNLFLMLCGHVGDQGRRQDSYGGHTVHTLLSDYQGWSNGGDGWLRIMEFSPANNVIRVRTYTPWLDQYRVTPDSSSQFTLAYDMSGPGPFQLVGTATGVPAGSHATMSWPGLAPGTSYEWYATVSDGATTSTGATWTFTTATGGNIPDAVTNLTATALRNGNDSDGTIRVRLDWTPPAQPGTPRVFRRPFGDYPRYRPGVGGVPAAPASPQAALEAGWSEVTSVTAPGQSDDGAPRGEWYYVVFTVGDGGPSAVSTTMPSALNYILGDVHDGQPGGQCMGNNRVFTEDLSYLGGHYGVTVDGDPDLACLDIGPTLDGHVTSRPVPDGQLEFEDLVMFALDFGVGSTPLAALHREAPAAAGDDALALVLPALPEVGGTFEAVVRAHARGDLQALRLELGYDASRVEMTGVEEGELLHRQAADAVVLSPGPGRVDVALLGRGAALAGSGELARVRFRVKAPGDPGLALRSAEGRDGNNRAVGLGPTPGPGAVPAPPARTVLGVAYPNPFGGTLSVQLSLSRDGPATLAVYDVTGRRVRVLLDGHQAAGRRAVVWDGRDAAGVPLAPGFYVLRLEAAEVVQSRTVRYVR